jgi:hypothetical protein
MRNFCLKAIFAAASMLTWSAMPSPAEVLTYVQIQVPFAFNVGDVALPAGNYEIVQPHETAAIIVRPAGQSKPAAAIVAPFHEGTGTNASFVRAGGKYFLSTIALGDGRMVQLAAPRVK